MVGSLSKPEVWMIDCKTEGVALEAEPLRRRVDIYADNTFGEELPDVWCSVMLDEGTDLEAELRYPFLVAIQVYGPFNPTIHNDPRDAARA